VWVWVRVWAWAWACVWWWWHEARRCRGDVAAQQAHPCAPHPPTPTRLKLHRRMHHLLCQREGGDGQLSDAQVPVAAPPTLKETHTHASQTSHQALCKGVDGQLWDAHELSSADVALARPVERPEALVERQHLAVGPCGACPGGGVLSRHTHGGAELCGTTPRLANARGQRVWVRHSNCCPDCACDTHTHTVASTTAALTCAVAHRYDVVHIVLRQVAADRLCAHVCRRTQCIGAVAGAW
jgi:hypothetical protein